MLRDAERAILTTFTAQSVTALVCILYSKLLFTVSQNVCGARLFFFSCLVCTVLENKQTTTTTTTTKKHLVKLRKLLVLDQNFP